MNEIIKPSELILNDDGSIYHLHLLPEQIADTIITVGDPDRVEKVSKYFDKIEHKIQKREFVTHTGYIGNKRLTVISTGIGTDNIDIVINELDALVNIDLHTRQIKKDKKSLNIIRIGTSGTLQGEIDVDSIVLSSFGLGLDGLMNFYVSHNSDEEEEILLKINKAVELPIKPCIAKGSEFLLNQIKTDSTYTGITISATGFYGPQGRTLRMQPKVANFIDELAQLKFDNNERITNLEMETSAIYGMGKVLGHHCLSVNTILANRQTKEFSKNPAESVEKVISYTLDKLVSIG
ncbi:MAG: nucleoside phosphorylase [Chitinophagales bacterium]|nr:nucleoside phosphorylase [Chitinophagales bacterium]